MKKSLSIISMSMLLAVFTVACGSNEESNAAENNAAANEESTEQENNASENENTEVENAANESNENAGNAEVEETPAEITVEHELGETVVPTNPENVVVFDYGVLDTLREIGVDPIAVPQGNIPEYLGEFEGEEYENAGTLFEPDFETIYGLEPDLIIISGRAAEAYDELSEIAPTIHVGVDTANYVESFQENSRLLGEIFGETELVETKLAEIDEAIATLHETATANEITGLFTLANEGELSAYGLGSRFGIIHDEFGIPAADENIEDSSHGQNVSFEYVLETNPDYLFVMDRGAAIGDDEFSAQETIENELIKQTTAYQEDNVVYVDPSFWYLAAGGLTSVAGMVEDVQEGLE
ncbi:siderophore ABC transporter substrate-binding protein [Salipaludibacillus sp. CF4.18]|uniref:siderophore ABC transporter substrate-binding protein n=1 Tax=Salipaludibacillus sp. CF4.18 TaxID=3373081 RepID=UPI003EE7708A